MWPRGIGQLTPQGWMQHYIIGDELRKRFITQVEEEQPKMLQHQGISLKPVQLLSPTFDMRQVYIRSTDFNRTFESAEAQLSGLYNLSGMIFPVSYQQWAKPPFNVSQFDWGQDKLNMSQVEQLNTFPIFKVDRNSDTLLKTYISCKYLKQTSSQFLQCESVKKRFEREVHFFEYLSKKIDQKISNLTQVTWIQSTLNCQKYFGIPIPISDRDLNKLDNLTAFQMYYEFFATGLTKKLGVSNLFTQIIDFFDQKVQDIQKDLRFVFYSSHDTLLRVILDALDVWDQTYQPFASTIFFELYESVESHETLSHKDYRMQIRYNDKVLRLPDCDAFCPFEQVKELMLQSIVPNLEEICLKEVQYQKDCQRFSCQKLNSFN